MTEFIGGALAAVDGAYWLPLLLNAALKGSIILGLAVLMRRLLRRSSASIRHAVGASALAALLALPLMWTLLPAWHLPLLSAPPDLSQWTESAPSQESRPTSQTLVQAQSRRSMDLSASPQAATRPSSADLNASRKVAGVAPPAQAAAAPDGGPASAVVVREASPSQAPVVKPRRWAWAASWLRTYWPALTALLWLGVACLLLLRLFYAMLGVWWITSRSLPCPDASWQRLIDQLGRRMGLMRPVRIVFSDHLEVALSVGLWKPVIIVPSEARRWNRSRLESIILHELAHVRRWDNVFNVLAQVVSSLYWFHPLVWRVQSRLTIDREQACDDAVLAAGARAPDYAQHLLQVARAVLPTRRRLLRTVEVSQSSALKDRLEAILETGRNRSSLGGLSAAVLMIILLMAAPLAALRPWADTTISLSRPKAGKMIAKRSPAGSKEPQELPEAPWRLASARQPPTWEPARRAFTPESGDENGPFSSSSVSGLWPRMGSGPEGGAAANQPSRSRPLDGFSEIPERTGLPLVDPSRLSLTGIFLPEAPGDGGGEEQPGRPIDNPRNRVEDDEGDTPQQPQDPDSGEDGGDQGGQEDPGQDPEPQEPEEELSLDAITPEGMQGPFGQALDVNDSGTVVGIATTEEGEFRPFVWDQGSGARLLDTLGGFGGSQLVYGVNQWATSAARAVGVNDRQEVIGISSDQDGRIRSFYWSESTGMLDMGSLGGGETQVRAINERGQAVGFSLTAAGRRRAFVWTLEGGMRDLGGDPQLISEAHSINDLGQVVGEIGFRPFLWEEEAGMFRLASEEIMGSAQDINDSTSVVGWAIFRRGEPRKAFIWSPDAGMENLGTLGQEFDSSRAVAINQEGAVLGSSSTPPNPFLGIQTQRAFLWTRRDAMTDIDEYGGGGEHVPELAFNNQQRVASRLPRNPLSGSVQSYLWVPGQGTMLLNGGEEEEYHVSSPTALNDLGEIAGTALVSRADSYFGDIYRPVVWRPSGLQRQAGAGGSDPLSDLRDELDGLDDSVDSGVREVLEARLQAAARKWQAGMPRQAQIDLYRLAVMAEQALQRQELPQAQGSRLLESAVALMNSLSRDR